MFAHPILAVIDLSFIDKLLETPAIDHRHRQPLRAGARFDAIAAAPIATCILHVVIDHELVRAPQLIKKAEPRYKRSLPRSRNRCRSALKASMPTNLFLAWKRSCWLSSSASMTANPSRSCLAHAATAAIVSTPP